MSQVSVDELNWGLIAWAMPLGGGVLGLIMRPNSSYVKHWSYLSIAFGLVIIVVAIVLNILSLLTVFIPPLFILIRALGYIVGLVFVVAWVVGIVRERGMVYWKPALIYDVARVLGAQ